METAKKKTTRGEAEQTCLDDVRKYLFAPESFHVVEDQKILNILKSARANEKASEFPDFLFEGGFIEHFQVSDSKETGKGCTFKQEEFLFQKRSEQELEDCKKEWEASPITRGEVRVETKEMPTDLVRSYELYVENFKKHFEDHIESLRQYEGEKDTGIFLIDMLTVNLHIKGTYPVEFYRVYYDKNILEYLKGFQSELKYVIFAHSRSSNVIQLSLLDKLIKIAPQNIIFETGRIVSIKNAVFWDLDLKDFYE